MKTQIPIPVWQQAGTAESILNQVRKLTRELHAMQNELYRELSEEDGTRRQSSALRQSPAHDDLKNLQTAADQLRRVLWFYLDLESQERAQDTAPKDSAMTEDWLPEDTQDEAALSEQRPQDAGSFFERLNLVIDNYMPDRGLSRNDKSNKS